MKPRRETVAHVEIELTETRIEIILIFSLKAKWISLWITSFTQFCQENQGLDLDRQWSLIPFPHHHQF